MKGPSQARQPPLYFLKFMSINVGRGGSAHDIALGRACDLQLDILLIQEPWWSGRTKSHPYFDRHIPLGVLASDRGPQLIPERISNN